MYEKYKIWFQKSIYQYHLFDDCTCESNKKYIIHTNHTECSDVKKANYKFQRFKDKYVVWNYEFGAGISILNKPTFDLLQNIDAKIEDKNVGEIIDLFVARGLLTYRNQEIKELPSNILSTWLHLANNCNLSCSYCYLNKTKDFMTLETGIESVKSIFNTANKNEIKEITLKFAGAEPLFNWEVAKKIQELALQLADKHDIKLNSVLLTNTTLLNDEIINRLKQLQFRVMVSIDGVGKYHDYYRSFKNGSSSYPIVIENTEKLHQAKLLSDISITVTDKNIEGLPELVKMCLERDYPFNINFYRENENTTGNELTLSEKKIVKYMKATYKIIENNLPNRNLLSSLLDRVNLAFPHKHTCGIGNNYAVIDQNGKLSKCQMEIGKNKTCTTINSNNLLADIKGDKTQLQNISVDDKSDCQNCEIKNYCTGGCPLIASKNGNSKSPNCNIYKSLYKDVLVLEGKRLLKHTKPHVLN